MGVVGCGAIGTEICTAIDHGELGMELKFLIDKHPERIEELVKRLNRRPEITLTGSEGLTEILDEVDLVIECASQDAVREFVIPALHAGKEVMIMSVGALVDPELLRRLWKEAKERGCRIYIPSGAIVGVDGVRAASQAGIESITLTTRKPPRALADSPYVVERGIDLRGIKEPVVVFEGKASEAVKHFPRSVNVAATLSLAGIGPDRTVVRIIADPNVDRNIHEVRVKGRFGEIVTVARNVPSPDNPKTSYLAALSAVDTLRRVTEPLLVGA